MAIRNIIDVCYVRTSNGLSCKDCIYYGKVCNNTAHRNNVTKPYEIEDRVLKEKVIKERMSNKYGYQ